MIILVHISKRYLQNNGINAGELGLFSVKILNGTLEQKDLGVLDIGVHLLKMLERRPHYW